MRFSPHPELRRTQAGEPALLILHPGSAGEQLFGIKSLQEMLGIGEVLQADLPGLSARTQTKPTPADRVAYWRLMGNKASHSVTALILDSKQSMEREHTALLQVVRGGVRRELYIERTKARAPSTTAAWSGTDIGVLTTDPDVAKLLLALHNGLVAGDGSVALWLCSSSNPYGRASLILALVDRVDESERESLRISDEEILFAKKISHAVPH